MRSQDRNTRAIQAVLPRIQPGTIKKLREETHIHVHVDLPPEASPRYRERFLQAQLALNLLPRMFKKVTSSGVNRGKLFPQSPSHQAKIADLSADASPTVVIALTDAPITYGAASIIYADNRGWTAYRSRTGPCPDATGSPNPIGALYAAALAVSEAFNTVLQPQDPRIQLITESHRHDLITYRENAAPNFEPRLDGREVWLDDVVIAGLGAVGQALVYALATIPELRGEIRLIDHEATDETNMARYVLSFLENNQHLKTDIASEHLLRDAHVLLRVHINVGQRFRMGHVTEIVPVNIPMWSRTKSERNYNPPADYVAVQEIRSSAPSKTVVSCVDTAATRRDIQMGLHQLVLDGWTKTDEHGIVYGLGAHAIDGDWHCLACSHHKAEARDLTEAEFAARITGWPTNKVGHYFRTGEPVRGAELEAIADRLGLDDERKLQLRDRPLRDVIHLHCGLAGMAIQGRFETSPVFHIPALVGIHLATELIARALGAKTQLENYATFKAAIPPNDAGLFVEKKAEGCLCQDADVKRVYSETWPKAPGATSPEDALASTVSESNAPLNRDPSLAASSEATGWQASTQ